MSSRELIVLGTSSQVPTRYRNHNGYLLRWDDEGILFDPGEGTQRQMIYAGVSTSMIQRICITHFHGDHCLGLAGMVQRISLDRVPHTIPIHYPASGQIYFDRLRASSIFHDVSDLLPCPVQDEGTIHADERFRISVRRLDHGVESFGYRLDEVPTPRMCPDKLAALQIVGKDIGELQRAGSIQHQGKCVRLEDVSTPRAPQSFAFIMDTRLCDAAFALAEGVDLLVCESTYLDTERREAKEYGHMTALQAARIAKEAGARRLVLTHFSQRYADIGQFTAEASTMHDDVVAAVDGKRIAVPPRRP